MNPLKKSTLSDCLDFSMCYKRRGRVLEGKQKTRKCIVNPPPDAADLNMSLNFLLEEERLIKL
jgi:hypothetical protein